MRVLGLDLGTKRIGVAVSDRGGTIASPLSVIQRGRTQRVDHDAIARLVEDEEIECVVVGLPINMNGTEGPAARHARDEAARLATVIKVPVVLHDERLTTVEADRALLEARMKAQARRRVVDKVAAAVMLQSWLDGKNNEAGRG